MKGPQNTDIDNILAGLKPKAPAPQPVQPSTLAYVHTK